MAEDVLAPVWKDERVDREEEEEEGKEGELRTGEKKKRAEERGEKRREGGRRALPNLRGTSVDVCVDPRQVLRESEQYFAKRYNT